MLCPGSVLLNPFTLRNPLSRLNFFSGDVANSFAKHFYSKVNNFVNATQVNRNVYNGKNKLIVPNRNFMQKSDVKDCLNLLPNKKCEGFDQIPVCILKDSKTLLHDPLTELFNKIYHTCEIPDQC